MSRKIIGELLLIGAVPVYSEVIYFERHSKNSKM